MVIDKIYKVADKWYGDISGPMNAYPASEVQVIDDSEIPVPIPPPVVVLTPVDNVDSKLLYEGSWFNGPTTAPGFYGGTMAYSNTAGNKITLTFIGTSIEVFCEKKVGHGSGTFQLDAQAPQKIDLGVDGGVVSVFKVENLPNSEHKFVLTIVGPNYVVFDYIKINGTAVITVPPIPPTTDTIIQPGQSIKAAVEGASAGKVFRLLAGLYSENMVNVPVGVSILGAGRGQTAIEFVGTHPQQSETAMFQLKSTSQVNGKQTLSGFTVRGKYLANGGIITDKRDNVIIEDVFVRETTYFDVWLKNTTAPVFRYSELYNGSWASTGWVTGELCLFNAMEVDIHHNFIHTDRPDKGYGIKALWPDGTVSGKMYSNQFQMIRTSMWNNGQAPNIDIELHNTSYAGLEFYDNDFSVMGLSLASHKATKAGKTIVRNNRFKWSMTSHIELVCSDVLIEANIFNGASMMTANFKPNGKWINQTINNNDFISDGVNPSWGGTHLIGADGANMNITGNRYNNLKNYAFIKHMGAVGNSVIVDSGNIKNQ